MTRDVKEYQNLIQQFLSDTLSASEFARVYLEKFLDDQIPLTDDEFCILDKLFADADNFSDDPELHGQFPGEHLKEDGLRLCAKEALEQLEELGDR